MARKNIPFVELPLSDLKNEIDRWAGEMGNLAFLRAICKTFCNEVEEYYKAGTNSDDRLKRLEEIRQTLVAIGFEDDERTYTVSGRHRIPASSVPDLLNDRVLKDCRSPMECSGGACVMPANSRG